MFFVRHDAVKKPLQQPYDGPYQVISRAAKHFTMEIKGKQEVISIDRLKPAFLESIQSDVDTTPASLSRLYSHFNSWHYC